MTTTRPDAAGPGTRLALDRVLVRSARGQLTLFALTFVGALGLAVVTLALRTTVFERYVRVTYPAPSPRVVRLTDRVAEGNADPDDVRAVTPAELETILGAWLAGEGPAASERVARDLLWAHPAPLLERVRVALVAGDPRQRTRALDLLELKPKEVPDHETVALCRYHEERSRRRGERDLLGQTRRVLNQLISNPGASHERRQ